MERRSFGELKTIALGPALNVQKITAAAKGST
jgi:hypothetical protein